MKNQIENVRFPMREPEATYGAWFIVLIVALLAASAAAGFLAAILL